MCTGQEYQRKLHPDDLPLRAQSQRQQRGEVCHFLVRKNPNYSRSHVRKQLLLESTVENSQNNDNNNTLTRSDKPLSCSTCDDHPTALDDSCANKLSSEHDQQQQQQNTLTKASAESIRKSFLRQFFCNKCQNSLNNNNNNNNQPNCEYCRNKNSAKNTVYSPVYNIREIRTASHTFSSLGIDKKLLESSSTPILTAIRYGSNHSININNKPNKNKSTTNGKNVEQSKEQVNTNPSKGFGNFVYI